MSAFEVGEYVIATRNGSGVWARGGGRRQYKAGDEFLITSLYDRHVNVRDASGTGHVFQVGYDQIRRLPRMVGQIPEGGISPEHPGLTWLFEDAARMADRLGLCDDYDRLCDALGIPGRIRTFTVDVFSAEGIKVTAKVEARSQRLAEQRVREQLAPAVAAPLVLEASRTGAPQ